MGPEAETNIFNKWFSVRYLSVYHCIGVFHGFNKSYVSRIYDQIIMAQMKAQDEVQENDN